MSSHTIATLPRISREKLADLVRAKSPTLAIIDVRDSDYVNSAPFSLFQYALLTRCTDRRPHPWLPKHHNHSPGLQAPGTRADTPRQGPSSLPLRALATTRPWVGVEVSAGEGTVGGKGRGRGEERWETAGRGAGGQGAGEGVCGVAGEVSPTCRVHPRHFRLLCADLVVCRYGEDPELTEGYRKELWEED